MPDEFYANHNGRVYQLIVGEQEACAIQFSPTDGEYQARWFGNITDAMSWWKELNAPDL